MDAPQGGGEVMVKQATTIYDTIYLHDEDGDVTWCQDRISDSDVEYRRVPTEVLVSPTETTMSGSEYEGAVNAFGEYWVTDSTDEDDDCRHVHQHIAYGAWMSGVEWGLQRPVRVEPWSEVAPSEPERYWFTGVFHGEDRHQRQEVIVTVVKSGGGYLWGRDDAGSGRWPLGTWSGRWQRVMPPGPLEGDNGS
jgi:hypothetical protein